MLNLTRLFLLIAVVFAPTTSSATNNAELLEQQALTYLNLHYNKVRQDARTEIHINPISRRLNLKTCQEDIQFEPPRGNGSRITFRARCLQPQWQLFITAQINQYANAVISRHSLPRKTILSKKHLTVAETDVTNLRTGFYSSTADLIGSSTLRNIPEGAVITPNILKPPLAIKKGYSVIIEAIRSGVSIKATGTALEDGEIGEQIQVRNDRSGRIIKARVIKAGLVRAP